MEEIDCSDYLGECKRGGARCQIWDVYQIRVCSGSFRWEEWAGLRKRRWTRWLDYKGIGLRPI